MATAAIPTKGISPEFGAMVRARRHAIGMTIETLAVRIGWAIGALSELETGKRVGLPAPA